MKAGLITFIGILNLKHNKEEIDVKIHPYALIIGIGVGIGVLASLRHPPFAIFAAIISVILLDLGYKRNTSNDDG